MSKSVAAKIAGDIEATINRHVEHAVREIRSALEDRVLALETTCSELLEGFKVTEEKLQDENQALRTRVSELEHTIFRQEHDANLVVSGLPDDGNEEEDTKMIFLDMCKDTLQVEVKSEEVLKAVRLGRKLSSGSSRPRAVLVRTTKKDVKDRIMARRGPHLRGSGIYLNEDLSPQEQAMRKTLVPVFKEFRAAGARCRLDRACLLVDQYKFFDADNARQHLKQIGCKSSQRKDAALSPQ